MRQYVAQKSLDKNGLLSIEGKDYRYLKQVLRLSVGDMISVRFKDCGLKNMTVCRVDDAAKKIVLQLCAENSESPENQPDNENSVCFDLFMFVPKSSKFDLIVRQATECGISRIYPVSGEFSQKGAEKMNFRGERFERIIKEARQQSGSAVDTQIQECITVKQLCELWQNDPDKENSVGCVLYERNEFTTSLKQAFAEKEAGNIKKCAVVCGAEGGISPEEIKDLIKAGFKPIHFKTNILRCETAALYGIAALQNFIAEQEDE